MTDFRGDSFVLSYFVFLLRTMHVDIFLVGHMLDVDTADWDAYRMCVFSPGLEVGKVWEGLLRLGESRCGAGLHLQIEVNAAGLWTHQARLVQGVLARLDLEGSFRAG